MWPWTIPLIRLANQIWRAPSPGFYYLWPDFIINRLWLMLSTIYSLRLWDVWGGGGGGLESPHWNLSVVLSTSVFKISWWCCSVSCWRRRSASAPASHSSPRWATAAKKRPTASRTGTSEPEEFLPPLIDWCWCKFVFCKTPSRHINDGHCSTNVVQLCIGSCSHVQ